MQIIFAGEYTITVMKQKNRKALDFILAIVLYTGEHSGQIKLHHSLFKH